MSRFAFDFDPAYRALGLPFGITPGTAWVEVEDGELRVRYGPWRLRTPLTNVVSTQETGGFTLIKTAGPPHLSFSDRGVSFTTNGRRALCVEFASPVKGIDPSGLIRHPNATLSVLDVEGLARAVGP